MLVSCRDIIITRFWLCFLSCCLIFKVRFLYQSLSYSVEGETDYITRFLSCQPLFEKFFQKVLGPSKTSIQTSSLPTQTTGVPRESLINIALLNPLVNTFFELFLVFLHCPFLSTLQCVNVPLYTREQWIEGVFIFTYTI